MTGAPPLADGESMLHEHIPSLGKFKRAALVVLAISLVPTAVNAFVFPGSVWVAAPLFIACLILWQERATIGKRRAWVTDRRVVWQGGDTVHLRDITDVRAKSIDVRLRHGPHARAASLFYPADPAALAQTIDTARKDAP